MATVGEQIKTARKQANMTQSALANSAGISRSYLAGAEQGKYNPSFKVLKKIAAACSVDLNFFQ